MIWEESKASRSLEQLPVELIQAVLTELPDVSSLLTAALTGPCLYRAFIAAEAQITREVLLRQIHSNLLHDALAEISSRRETWTTQEAEDFLAQYFTRYEQPFHFSLQWKLSQALPSGRLHSLICFFVNNLTSSILDGCPVSKEVESVPPSQPLSQTENNRITRNFYRFQIYRNLFHDMEKTPIFADHSQRDAYFSHFAHGKMNSLPVFMLIY